MITQVGTCRSDPRPRPDDLPVSAKLVYKTLEYEGGLTQKELVEETRLVPRTVRYALTCLEDADLVEERVYLPDARQRVYALPERD